MLKDRVARYDLPVQNLEGWRRKGKERREELVFFVVGWFGGINVSPGIFYAGDYLLLWLVLPMDGAIAIFDYKVPAHRSSMPSVYYTIKIFIFLLCHSKQRIKRLI